MLTTTAFAQRTLTGRALQAEAEYRYNQNIVRAIRQSNNPQPVVVQPTTNGGHATGRVDGYDTLRKCLDLSYISNVSSYNSKTTKITKLKYIIKPGLPGLTIDGKPIDLSQPFKPRLFIGMRFTSKSNMVRPEPTIVIPKPISYLDASRQRIVNQSPIVTATPLPIVLTDLDLKTK